MNEDEVVYIHTWTDMGMRLPARDKIHVVHVMLINTLPEAFVRNGRILSYTRQV
jgi:hypothetical protein